MSEKPFVIDVEAGVDPSLAPPVPEAEGRAVQVALALQSRRRSRLGAFAGWAFGALFSFVISVAAYDFVASLLAANTVLGAVGFAVVALAVLAAGLLALREAFGFARLARLDGLRARVVAAGSLAEARAAVDAVAGLYGGRADQAWGLARMAERRADVMDADALLGLAEVELMAPLDAAARAEVEAAARQVAAVTALVPLALADVATALYANLRMIRRIAEIYGGRSGVFGSLRLMRRVFGHLVATGAVALTDDMIHSVAGGGLLSKLSRRFGEGVVNGALTARVGLAAIEVCRPMPFAKLAKPGVTETVGRALGGLFARGEG